MDDGWLIVFGVLAFVLLLNLGLILTALRHRGTNPNPMIRKSLADMLNPWKEEDQALDDLHKKVESLTRRDNE
jgi:hypothetical protein